jgi:polyisoprenoid-binding protein YceI
LAWTYDPNHSVITFENRYLGILAIKGRFKTAEVSFVVDEADPTRSSVEATIDAASIETDLPRRDATLRSETYLDTERYPTMMFRSKRIESRGDRYTMIGDLSLHGVTREIELDTRFNGEAVDARGDTRRGFSASAILLRSDFGINTNVEEAIVVAAEEVVIGLEVAVIKRE